MIFVKAKRVPGTRERKNNRNRKTGKEIVNLRDEKD